MKSRVFSVLSLLFISTVAIAAQFFILKIIGSWSGDSIAVWALFEALVAVVMAVGIWGGDYSVINRFNKNSAPINLLAYVFVLICSGAFVAAVLGLAAVGFSDNFAIHGYRLALLIASAIFCAIACCVSIWVRAAQKFFVAALLERAHIFGATLLCALCIAIGQGTEKLVELIFFASAASFLCAVVYFLVSSRSHWRKMGAGLWSSVQAIGIEKGALQITLTNVAILVYERADQFLILAFLGPAELAVYFVCYKISFAVRFVTKAVNQVFYTYIARANRNNKEENDLIGENFRINAMAAFFFAVCAMLFSERILEFLGSKYENGAFVLGVLCLSLYLSVPNQIIFNLINSRSGGSFYLRNAISTMAIQLFLIVSLITALGVSAVLIARISAVIFGNINAFFFAKRMGISYSIPKSYYLLGIVLVLILVVKNNAIY